MSVRNQFNRVTAVAVLCGAAVCFTNVVCRAAEQTSSVVAVVGGTALTHEDLERQSAKLLQARYQYYLAEKDALDSLIEDQLLKNQALKEHITTDQLIDREVSKKVTDPTEDQLEVYYEGLQTDKPFADVRTEILQTIRQMRATKLRANYIRTLRAKTDVEVVLATPAVSVPLGDAPQRGPADALVTVIEFADYECPYCQQVNSDLKKLQSDFAGKLTFAFKDFPLPMHAHSEKAAEAAHCAGAQGKFWEYHDLIFEKKSFELNSLKESAREVGLNGTTFDQCLASGAQSAAVKKDLVQGQTLGLTGTPSFFVNGHFISGAVSYTTLRAMVEQQIAEKSKNGGHAIAQIQDVFPAQ